VGNGVRLRAAVRRPYVDASEFAGAVGGW